MQIVEQGLVALDDDARDILPQLKTLRVITGWEGQDDEVTIPNVEESTVVNGTSESGPYSAKQPVEKPKGRPILEDVNGPITLR
jgi:hypothetical protein